jgi:hypothetical protein
MEQNPNDTVLSEEQLAEIGKGEAVELAPLQDGELAPVRTAESLGLEVVHQDECEEAGGAAESDSKPDHEQYYIGGKPVAPLAADGLPAFVTIQLVQAKIVDEVSTVIEDTGAAIVNLQLASGMSVQGFANFTRDEVYAGHTDPKSAAQKAIDVARANALVRAMEIEAYILADYRHKNAILTAQANQKKTEEATA